MKKIILLSALFSLSAWADTYVCNNNDFAVRVLTLKASTPDAPGVIITNKRNGEISTVLIRDTRMAQMFEVVYSGVPNGGNIYNVKLMFKDISTPVGGKVDAQLRLEGRYDDNTFSGLISCVRGSDPFRN